MLNDRSLGAASLFATVLVFAVVHETVGQDKPASTSRRANFLIDASSLKNQLATDELSVVDVRERSAYAKSHIAGAVWTDINAWRSKGGESLGIKDLAYWSRALGDLGISPERQIVVVGEVVTESARCWWLLKYLGMPRVKLLDGGFSSWTAAGYATTDQAPVIKVVNPKIEFQISRLAELKDLLPDSIGASGCQVIDNRSAEEFMGKRQVGARAGHIPAAIHLEWKHFVDASGKFLSDEALLKLLAESKINPTKPAITHCQTGGRSSVGALVLEMLGGKEVRNYYAGWSEYSGQLTAPIEK